MSALSYALFHTVTRRAASIAFSAICLSAAAQISSPQFSLVNDTICMPCTFPDTADVNGDGALDLIFSTPAQDTISWLQNMGGTGSFAPPAFLALNDHNLTIELVGDADGDGDPDMIGVALQSPMGIVALLRNNDGVFDTEIIDTVPNATRPLTRFADLDGDGHKDLLGLQSGTGEIWYRQLSDSSYQRDTIPYWCQQVPGPYCAIDVEGDGDLDVATYVPSGNYKRIVVLWNLGGGRWGPPTFASQQYGAVLSHRPAIDAIDFDHDGSIDLVVGGRRCTANGDGTFQLPSSLEPMNYQSISNVDCEPAPEAFASTSGPDQPRLNELSPSNTSALLEPDPPGPVRSLLLQLDADTLSDLLLGPVDGAVGAVYWRRNLAVPIPISYSLPFDTVLAGETVNINFPPTDLEFGTMLNDGDYYSGIGVFGDSLYTSGLPFGWTVITAYYISFNSTTECESQAQDSVFIAPFTGIHESTSPLLGLSPNPVNDLLSVNYMGHSRPTFTIHDLAGRSVQALVHTTSDLRRAYVDCTALSEGSYVLLMRTPELSLGARFVVAR